MKFIYLFNQRRTTSHCTISRIYCLCFYSIAVLTFKGNAQVVNIESQRIQTDTIRWVLNADAGIQFRETDGEKFSALMLNLTTQVKSRSLKDIFLLLAGFDYSRLDKKEISNSRLFHLRYNRKISRYFRLEAFTQYQKSPLTGVSERTLLGAGPRFKLIQQGYGAMYFGSLYMFESELEEGDARQPQTFHRISSYLSFSLHNAQDNLEFTGAAYYQPSILNVRDYRISLQSVFALKVNKHLFVTSNFNATYDAMPPSGFARLFYLNTYGLRLNI